VFTNALMYLVPIDFRDEIRKMFCDIDMVIGGFIRGQGLMSILAGILTGVGASVIGLPYASIIGVIAGVTTMIPYFGPAVGMVVICVMALFTSPILMVYILIWMGIVQVICGNVVAPALMSGDVGLHPVLIIFSIFFFGAMFGGLGMILAVPLMGTVRVVMKYLVAGFAQAKADLPSAPKNED
ncbi:MAG: AI-2E family transporter, partial [Eubacterium sp.]